MTPPLKCACRIVSPFGSRDMAAIEYCRLHLSAPALLEALKGMMKVYRKMLDHELSCKCSEKNDPEYFQAKAAIAEAEKGHHA